MTAGVNPVSIGPVAAEILAHDGDAEIAAVFERSFYVLTRHGYVAAGSHALGDGPLNILLDANLGTLDWLRLGITRETKGRIDAGRLNIGEHFMLDVSRASVWQPPAWIAASRSKIDASLVALRAAATPMCPAEGLSRLVIAHDAAHSDRTARAAASTLQDLRHALPKALAGGIADADLVRPATLMLGLGPGLTPSGDDLLGGVFLVLSAMGQTALRDDVWSALAPEMDLLTAGISGAHLAAAADGLGAERVHAALNAILAHDAASLPVHLNALSKIGHSSGFDTLAGIVLALDAALAAGVLA